VTEPLVRLSDGIRFRAGPLDWNVPPLRLRPGQWAAFVPDAAELQVDPSGPLARTLFSLSPPILGRVQLMEKDAYAIDYIDVQRLRASMGFVQGFGGLLSNRTMRDNVGLPVSVHGKFSVEEESGIVDRILDAFSLRSVENFKPHEVDGYTRWRACLARGLVLHPKIVVLEGLGDWEVDRGEGVAWRNLLDYHRRGDNVVLVAMSRMHPGFQSCFEGFGSAVVKFTPVVAPARQGVGIK